MAGTTRRKQRAHRQRSKRNCFQFKVTGKGTFPVDMLRRDNAFPVDPEDVRRTIYMTPEELRTGITMVLRSFYAPTVERWESFRWQVTDIQVVKREKEQTK